MLPVGGSHNIPRHSKIGGSTWNRTLADKLLIHKTDNPFASDSVTFQGGPQLTDRWPSISWTKRNRVDPGLVLLKSGCRIHLELYCKNMPSPSQDNQECLQKHFSRPSAWKQFLPLPRAEGYKANIHQTVENEGSTKVKVRWFPQSMTLTWQKKGLCKKNIKS